MDSATISRLFNENSVWMKRLALSLLRDEGWADDVVQETWLELVERPPARSDSLAGWISTVVRRFSLKKRRGEDRSERRQRLAARREVHEARPDRIVERVELHQWIVSLVLGLEEPLRSTILLRFFEDLRPAEIARLQGVPATTVRSRVEGGLATLRRRLDRYFGGDTSGWRAVLVPWAAEGAFGASRGASAVPSPAPSGYLAPTAAAAAKSNLGALGLTTGAIFMSQKAAISLGVVFGLAIGAGVGAWYAASGSDPDARLAGSRSGDHSRSRFAAGVPRVQEELEAAMTENARLRSLKERLQGDLDAARKKLEDTLAVSEAGGLPPAQGAGLNWSELSGLLTEHLEVLGKLAHHEKLTPEEQADFDLLFGELLKLSSRAKALNGAPFFDKEIFSGLVKSLYEKPLNLSESQRAFLEQLTGSLVERLPENAEDLSSLERLRLRRELAGRLEEGIRGVLEEDQLPAWEGIHEFSKNVFAYGGEMKLGLSVPPRLFLVNWCLNALGENFSEERFGGVVPVAEDYFRQAGGVMEAYGPDQKAIEALSPEQKEKLNSDLLRLEEGFLEQVKPHLSEDLRKRIEKEEPLLIRFEFGGGTSVYGRRRLF